MNGLRQAEVMFFLPGHWCKGAGATMSEWKTGGMDALRTQGRGQQWLLMRGKERFNC